MWKLPVLEAAQWYMLAGVLAATLALGSAGGYKLGSAFQAREDNKALAAGVAAADARASAAEAQRDDQAKEYAKESKARDDREALATQLYDDSIAAVKQTSADLVSARKRIKDIRGHDKTTQSFLDTPVPAALRSGVLSTADKAGN